MPSQPKVLLDLAARFLESAPWDFVPERSVFLVRIPGRELPLTVTVLGDTVDFNGMELLLEPDGFQRLVRLHSPESTDQEVEAYEPGRSLSVIFLPSTEIPPDFKKLWKAAGYRALGATPAPQFAAADANGDVRPIKRSEGTLLAYAMHAVLDALEVESLSSPDISEGVEATLLVTVPGDDPDAIESQQLPPTRAQIVPWPGADGVVPDYEPLTKGAVTRLRALPLDPEPLAAVLFPSAGAADKGVEKGQWVMLFFDPVAETLLDAKTLGTDTEDAREVALTGFLVEYGKRPEDLVIEGAGFALWAFGVAEQLGIEGRYGHFIGPFAEVLDRHVAGHGGTPIQRAVSTYPPEGSWGVRPEDPLTGDPKTPEEWIRNHDEVSWFLREGLEATDLVGAAQTRYFGGARATERLFELMGSLGAAGAFWRFATEDFLDEPGAPTAAESLAAMQEEGGLTPCQVADLGARLDSIVSVFRTSPDGSEVTDLLTQETYPVDLDFDRIERFGDHAMVLRHYQLQGLHGFAAAGPPWALESEDEFMGELNELLGSAPDPMALRTHGARLGTLWSRFVQRLEPALKASRGDPDH